jgi:hypothetical protein
VTTANVTDLIAKLQQLDAALGAPGDVSNTPDAQAKYWSEKRAIAAAIGGLRNAHDDLDKVLPKLAAAEKHHATVVAAQADVERLIAEAPDWRTIRDARERDRAWGRQQDLLASRRALTHGVEYFSGVPALPNALKQIVGVVIAPDGREVPRWYGPLSDIEAQVTRWTARRDAAQHALDAHTQAAEALLAAATMTTS